VSILLSFRTVGFSLICSRFDVRSYRVGINAGVVGFVLIIGSSAGVRRLHAK
jgi:hypothetical protein